ncbi:kanadaptin isoform X2 [Silurus asotus]|uniref:Kanadaptin isoform X2 n=1 Tax=Silurus asotus TaxID=30991 RepID=A0AAD5AM98_SILAS|nr:kanadaptin isoform X2 [Silurus asotus]
MADTVHAASESDDCLNPEIRSEMEVEKSAEEENVETKEKSINISEDPFKKPAIFAAPSVAFKKSKSVQKVEPESDSSAVKLIKDHPKPEALSVQEPSKESSENDDQSIKHDSENRNQPPVSKRPAPERQITATPKPDVQKSLKTAKVPPSGKFPPLPYTEPQWGGVAGVSYTFELLKNGAILDNVPLTQQSYFVVGRLPVCDISLEHPSISRYHAVVQYRGKTGDTGAVGEELGFYIYDLGSTHGTFVNKNKVPPKTYIRLHVGHVVKFGGSTRLFVLQGPETDEEAESELTVTELRERARKQREQLEKRMMGDGSDGDDDDDDDDSSNDKKIEEKVAHGRRAADDSGCSWGMGEENVPEEDENEENPFATEFHEDQEAAYLKDPKKALQGFYDREGEELEFEYDDKGHGTWLCRIKLPVDDAAGRQLIAEVTHSGKKKDAAVQCCLEACRMLEARGLLRQEAVSRKRKQKNWEEDDYYDSDDDSFLDRTGTVERKRKERMKKAGKIQERPETYDSLVSKLAEVEKDLAETENTLGSSEKGSCSTATDDPLDAFMSCVRSQAAVDVVQRKKLHLHVAELKKEQQRLRKLIDLTRPTQLPSLQSQSDCQSSEADKSKKLSLPLFGAMKGGSKFKLKTGTIGKLPPKRPNLPPELFNMKELPTGGEEEEEEEEMDEREDEQEKSYEIDDACEDADEDFSQSREEKTQNLERQTAKSPSSHGKEKTKSVHSKDESPSEPQEKDHPPPKKKSGKMIGPSRPPSTVSKQYPEDDPDYCVWVPPAGQTGDGRTHLNDKYGY